MKSLPSSTALHTPYECLDLVSTSHNASQHQQLSNEQQQSMDKLQRYFPALPARHTEVPVSSGQYEDLHCRGPWAVPFLVLDSRLATVGSLLTSRIPFPASQFFANLPRDAAFSGTNGLGAHLHHQDGMDLPTDIRRFSAFNSCVPNSSRCSEPQDFYPHQGGFLPMPEHCFYNNNGSGCHINPAQLTSENLLQHQQQHQAAFVDDCNLDNLSPLIQLDASVAGVNTPSESVVTVRGSSMSSGHLISPSGTRAPSVEPYSMMPMQWEASASLSPNRLSCFAHNSNNDPEEATILSTYNDSHASDGTAATCSNTSTSISTRHTSPFTTESTLSNDKSDDATKDIKPTSGAAFVLPDGTVAKGDSSFRLELTPPLPKKKGYSFYAIDKTRLTFVYSNKIELPPLDRVEPIPYRTRSAADVRHDPPRDGEGAETITAQPAKLGCGDLYTPRFVKSTSQGRFGWCDCGEWLGMKSSVYNYHLTTHGISCRTGQPFTPPEQIRWCRQERIIDAYCGHCNEWINLLRKMMRQVSWKNWFLHASHCHHKAVRQKPVTKMELKEEDNSGDESATESPAPLTKRARLA